MFGHLVSKLTLNLVLSHLASSMGGPSLHTLVLTLKVVNLGMGLNFMMVNMVNKMNMVKCDVCPPVDGLEDALSAHPAGD